jgi:hypothetical protein
MGLRMLSADASETPAAAMASNAVVLFMNVVVGGISRTPDPSAAHRTNPETGHEFVAEPRHFLRAARP